MRGTRSLRFLVLVFAVVVLASAVAPNEARAQFVVPCDVTATSVTCTNTGFEPADFATGPIPFFDVFAINSGIAQNISTETVADINGVTGKSVVINSNTALNLSATAHDNGSALILNTGMAADLLAKAETGSATVNNSSLAAFANSIEAWTDNGGDATANNSGSVTGEVTNATIAAPGVGIFTHVDGGGGGLFPSGTAVTNNSGQVTQSVLTTNSNGGNATTNNSGSVGGTVVTLTESGGDAATSNSSPGSANALITVTQGGGSATTVNSGAVTGSVDVSSFSPFTNYLHQDFSAQAPNGAAIFTGTYADGNATTINTNTVLGTIVTATGLVGGSGDATTANYGIVRGDIYTSAADAGAGTGSAWFSNYGQVVSNSEGVSVLAYNGNATFNNDKSGTIDVSNATTAGPGLSLPGIVVATGTGGDATATNSGSIIGDLSAVTLSDGNATINNHGNIYGDIYAASAFFSGTGNAALNNNGKIVSGLDGVTVLAGSGTASFNNTGAIDVSNGLPSIALDTGIIVQSENGNATAYNSGRILGGIGVMAGDFAMATLTNAGLIDGTKSPLGIAVDLSQPFNVGVQSTLNIMPGSRILGSIILNGDPGDPVNVPPTTVNIFSGHDVSSILTFGDVCGCGGLTETGAKVNVFGGAPYVINGNTVAVLDPTSFAAQDRNVLDFTRTVLSAASSRLTSPAPMSGDGSAALGFAPSGNIARDMANDAFANIPALAYANQDRVLRSNPTFTAADGTSIWAQGFGGVRVQNASGPNLRSVNQFYGGLLGVDKTLQPGLRAGAFVGGGSVSSQIDMNSGNTTSDMGFGGVYARYAMNKAFLDFALLGGGSSNNVKRAMTNNFAPGGYEYANGNYSGWFVSPELAYGVRHDLTKDWTVTPTARVRYLAANFGGYQESGSSANLTVAGRTAQNFEERGELVFTRTTSEREGSLLQISATIGALAWQRLGDANVNTVLLGQALAFVTPGQANVVGGYFGGGFEWRNASGLSVFAASEVDIMSDSSHTLSGRGGIKLAF